MQLAIISRNAARDCRGYIRIIEWIAAEQDDLDDKSVDRILQEIQEILPVPEFESDYRGYIPPRVNVGARWFGA